MMALQTSVQLQKFWIKPVNGSQTVSKRTIEAGIHEPFSLRTARSELVRDSVIFLGLVRTGPRYPFMWFWTDQFWPEDKHDSGPPTSFFCIFGDLRIVGYDPKYKMLYQSLYRGCKLDYKHNHYHERPRPWIQGPELIVPARDQPPKNRKY